MRANFGWGSVVVVALVASCGDESESPGGPGDSGKGGSGAAGASGSAGASPGGEGGGAAEGGNGGSAAEGGSAGDAGGAAGAGGGSRTGAVGDGCEADDDCVFQRCASGECVAPDTGPEPTGAVDVVLDEDGGTATVVTYERVRLELEVPADALRDEVRFTFTPETPTDSSFLHVTSSIPGVAFRKNVTLRVTLPPGVTFDAERWPSMNGGDAEFFLVGWADEGANVFEIETSFLGNPASALATVIPVVAATGVLETRNWENYVINMMKLPLDQALRAVQQLLDDLEREKRAEDAARVKAVLAALVTKAMSENDPRIDEFLAEQRSRFCTAYRASVMAMNSATIECNQALKEPTEPVAALGAALQQMGSSCGADWASVISTRIGRVATFVRNGNNRLRRLSCECEFIEEEHLRALGCRRVIMGPPASAGELLAPSPEDEWDVILDTVRKAPDIFARFHILDAHTEADSLGAELADTTIEVARGYAFDECAADGDMSWLGLLGTVVPSPAAIQADAELCASSLTATVLDAQATVIDSGAIAEPKAVGAMSGAVEIEGRRGSTVELRGSVGTLLCRADAYATESVLGDTVRLELVHQSGQATALDTRQANAAREVISATSGFDVDVDTALTTLGVGSSDPVDFGLRLIRTTSGCASAYPAEATLFDVRVREPRPFEVVPFSSPVRLALHCGDGARDERPVGDYVLPQMFAATCGTARLFMVDPNTLAFDVDTTAEQSGFSGALRITVNRPGTIEVRALTPSPTMLVTLGCQDPPGPCGIFQPMLADPYQFVCADTITRPTACKAEKRLEGAPVPATASMHTNGGTGTMYFNVGTAIYDTPRFGAQGRVFTVTFTPDP